MDQIDEILLLEESEDEVIPYRYSITSYGADYPVDSLVQRLDREVIFVPKFQRSYVWTKRMASRFVESLLLGLPVPGIFLSKEQGTGKMLVIDGQQRLKTLQFFYQGVLAGREFALDDVQPQFEGKTYRELSEEDRLRLDDSIIHATIVKQDEPSEDDSSIFHIFERLNTGGMQLRPQEIRACIYYGEFNELLRSLNENESWRTVYGNPSKRLRDQELILRYFALYFLLDKYERPIKEFLNMYMAANRHLKLHDEETLTEKFSNGIEFVAEALGRQAFRPERALNVSVFDAVMVGITRRQETGPIEDIGEFIARYESLVSNEEFLAYTLTGTSDPSVLNSRINIATETFADIP